MEVARQNGWSMQIAAPWHTNAPPTRSGPSRWIKKERRRKEYWESEVWALAFHEGTEAVESGVPLPRYLIDVEARVCQALLVEPPTAFAAIA